MSRENQHVLALRDRILKRGDELHSLLEDLVRFTEAYVPRTHVPLWIVATPDEHFGGGGYNGGQMVVEASRSAEDILMHESLHFVLNRKMDQLEAAAATCGAGLDSETLSEGIAYALYPGIIGKRGAIEQDLAHLASEGKSSSDAYVRFNRLGFALTPLLEQALVHKTTLTQMLPAACDAWKKVNAEPWPPASAIRTSP